MFKREAQLKAAFLARLRLHHPDFIILRYAEAGAPDRSITANGRTTNWEYKHATPDFKSDGLQELVCMRLALEGHCRYVIWQETEAWQRTMIVHPRVVHERVGWQLEAEEQCGGFSHAWLVEQVRRAHLV